MAMTIPQVTIVMDFLCNNGYGCITGSKNVGGPKKGGFDI